MKFDGGTRIGMFPLNLIAPNGGCDPNGHDDANAVADNSNWTTSPDIEGIGESFWSQSENDVVLDRKSVV